jgi:hypothetical protein
MVIVDVQVGEIRPLVERISQDLVTVATDTSGDGMRVLVHHYDSLQKIRIAAHNAAVAYQKEGKPAGYAEWLAKELQRLENGLVKVMRNWISEYPVAEWALQQRGVGPVSVATLLAYLDVDKCRTAGSVWRYCGLDPTIEWKRGERRPFNAKLKRMCYLLGEMFRMHHKSPECFYGQIYLARKEYEQAKNERGEYAEQARAKLEQKANWTANQRSYFERGMLTPAHIDLRARRYAVKMFLAHFAWVYWETEKGEPWPLPYAVSHLGHVDVIAPPGYTPLARA